MKNKIKSMERPSTCVIYVRGSSLKSQEEACKEYAKQHGLKVLRVFKEAGLSAKTADRPQLKHTQTFLRQQLKKVGYVVVWHIDRLARLQSDYFALKESFGILGAEIKSAYEPIEQSPKEKFSQAILSAAAQYQNEITSLRTIAGIRAKKELLENQKHK